MPQTIRHPLIGLAIVLAGLSVVSTPASAQDVKSNKPGVINRGGDQDDQNESDDQDQQPAADDSSGADQANSNQADGQVITPNNVDPNEQYNLPPNFDPDYRPKRTPRNTKVTLDFRQANLQEVVKFFAAAMNKNFIISDSLKANKSITIISPQEVTLAQAYRAFVSALEMNGLTIIPSGKFSKIVEAKQAISEPMTTYKRGERLPSTPRMVTAIVPMESTPPEDMEDVIGKFASENATIIPFGNSLIITENAANLQRLRRLVRQLDRDEANQQVYVYDVQYAEATEVQEKLEEIFQDESSQSTANKRRRRRRKHKTNKPVVQADDEGDFNVQISQILADERTNKIIIVAGSRDFDKIKEMIEILDVPTAVGGQVHIKFLEYADSEEVASALSNLTSGQSQQNSNARARRRRQQQQSDGGAGQVAALLQGEVQITAYEPNNALIVTAAPKDFVALESVIDELDRPRKQVYVEAVIMEIAMDNDRQLGLGVSAVTGKDYDGLIPDSAQESGIVDDTRGGIVGKSNFGSLASIFSPDIAGSIGLIGPLATIPGTEISLPAFALTLQATQTDRSVNLLSAPAVMTMDNEEAEIVVADRVPFVSGLGGGGGGLGGLAGLAGLGGQNGQNGAGALGGLGGLGALGGLGISPIEYEDVGITLRIKPQINESNYVRLDIDEEVSDLKGASNLGSEVPTRTKRTAKTVVLVRDQSTIVIGGLMKDRETKSVTKIPFLGDIPVIGALFRNTGTIKTKQNLVLMLTPYIIESEIDVRKIYERKMKERRELTKLFKMKAKEYHKSVNYQKKGGLIERMRRTLEDAQQTAKARQEALDEFKNKGSRYQILGRDEPTDDAPSNPDQSNPDQSNQDQSSQDQPSPPPAQPDQRQPAADDQPAP